MKFQIIKHTIILCLRDANSENQEFKNSTSTPNLRPEVAQLIVKRDGNWRMETETNLKEYVSESYSNLFTLIFGGF